MSDFIAGLDLEKIIKTSCLASVLIGQINKKLFGEVMTLIDASIRDVDSKKAMKSLVSQAFTRCTRQIVLEINELPSLEGEK